jgi:superfamily II DNA or RNA helicase
LAVVDPEFTWFPVDDEGADEPPFVPVVVGREDWDYTQEAYRPEVFDEKYDVSLREYQEKAVRAIFARWRAGDRGTGIEHATATGKTYVFSAVIARYERAFGRRPDGKPRRFLVLAHRDYLLTQAARTLLRMHVDCAIEQGNRKARNAITADEFGNLFGEPSCVIASVMSMQDNGTTKRLLEWDEDYFDLIVVDEGHHVLSPVYRKILNHFNYKHLLIVSGTFDRLDGRNVGEVIDSIADRYLLDQAVEEEWVCNVKVKWVKLQVDISTVKSIGRGLNKDLNEVEIARIVAPHVEPFAWEIKRLIEDRQAILFAPSVEVSRWMADALTSLGIKSEHLDAKSKNRDEVLREYRAGHVRIVCNYGLFSEGYDMPEIGAVILMRPTLSRALYCQMVGRGLRPNNGDDLWLIDFPWVSGSHRLVKPTDLFFTKGSKYTEEVIREAERFIDDQEIDDILAAIKRADEEIKVYDRFKLEISDGRAQSTVIEYNPLSEKDRAKLPRRRQSEEVKFRPPTPNMIRYLESQGIAGADGLPFQRAMAMVKKYKQREEAGYAPKWMVDRLQEFGVDRKYAKKLMKPEAAALWNELKVRGRYTQPGMF